MFAFPKLKLRGKNYLLSTYCMQAPCKVRHVLSLLRRQLACRSIVQNRNEWCWETSKQTKLLGRCYGLCGTFGVVAHQCSDSKQRLNKMSFCMIFIIDQGLCSVNFLLTLSPPCKWVHEQLPGALSLSPFFGLMSCPHSGLHSVTCSQRTKSSKMFIPFLSPIIPFIFL